MTNPLISIIKPHMLFLSNNNIITADENGSHYNSDEECWIVYDKYGNCYFEEDIQEVYERGFESCYDVYDKVKYEYDINDVSLSHLFFDFPVYNIPKIDLLDIYAQIQHDINGDYVLRVEKGSNGLKITDLDNKTLHDNYSGNLKDFYENLEKTDKTLCRFIELNTYFINNEEIILDGESVAFFHEVDNYETYLEEIETELDEKG